MSSDGIGYFLVRLDVYRIYIPGSSIVVDAIICFCFSYRPKGGVSQQPVSERYFPPGRVDVSANVLNTGVR